MSIPVREVLKQKLPYTLSEQFSHLSANENQHSLGWDTLDPQTERAYSMDDPQIKSEIFDWSEYPEYSCKIPMEQPSHEGGNFDPNILEDDYWDHESDIGGWNWPKIEPTQGTPTVFETAAYYKPFHFHDDWGIYLKEMPVLRLKVRFQKHIIDWIQAKCTWNALQYKSITKIINDTALRLAALRYYSHELFHHKVEAFATRCEAVRETPVYILGFHYTHRNTQGFWEEPLAECHMLSEISDATQKTWKQFEKDIKKFVVPAIDPKSSISLLRMRIFNQANRIVQRNTPYPYNRGTLIFPTWEKNLQEFRQNVLQSIGFQAKALELTSGMDKPYRYKTSKGFWVVVPKGHRPPRWMQVLAIF